jgi:hypothetical protein
MGCFFIPVALEEGKIGSTEKVKEKLIRMQEIGEGHAREARSIVIEIYT